MFSDSKPYNVKEPCWLSLDAKPPFTRAPKVSSERSKSRASLVSKYTEPPNPFCVTELLPT
eukprot:TRINITY_DN4822_c0_g1_i1.p2 TRINITY_DN4822_c0_g1~~TRINITY_DN4822_c0_g1_i1.p2  ORF type:complete len:61 (-),score=7.11 TRINITY_DN4822_c0_g1_i1:177-359(-)